MLPGMRDVGSGQFERLRDAMDELRTHLWFAKTAAGLAVLVAVTGVYLWRTGRGRRVHFWCVVAFLVGTVVATGTGIWAFSLSTLR